MKYRFSDIVEIKKLQSLMDKFYEVTGIGTAILSIEGEILTGSGWQDICTKFHRVHPDTGKRCTESDTALASQLKAGEKYNVYKCLNGLVDVAAPIMLEDEHVATLFSGQFFFEKPDVEFFRKQAATFGFDENSYLAALAKVPIFSEEKVKGIMIYLSGLAELIGEIGMTQKRQLEIAEEQEQMVKHLNRLTSVMENTSDLVAMSDLQGNIVYINFAGLKMLGRLSTDLADLKIPDFHPPEVSEKIVHEHLPIVMEKGTFSWESKVQHIDGNTIPVSQVIMLIRSETGEPESFGTIMRDISQTKQNEENLRVSEERHRELVENLRKEIAERERAEKEVRRLNEALEKRIREKEGKYLIFNLADESYGISILKIREIVGMMSVIPVPNMPEFIKGVINLRGRVIPVADIRLKFDMPAADYTDRTCIIVTELTPKTKDQAKTEKLIIGVIVDSVSEVLNIKGMDIEDTPDFGIGINTDYILGIAKTKEDVKILLNIEAVFEGFFLF